MERLKQLYVKTYGCQMNVYDSERIEEMLQPLGYQSCEDMGADVILFNTCQIREKAEDKLFSDLGRAHLVKKSRKDEGKETIIVVAGCSAQALGKELLKRTPYVDLVVGPQTYDCIPEMLARIAREKDEDKPGKGKLVTGFPKISKFDRLATPRSYHGVSAFLSIQEGCDKFCRYCVVPYTRGAEFSRPVQEILEEAKVLIGNGAKEITLLGQNVSAYHGLDSQEKVWGLGRLLEAVAEIPGLKRLRYTTSHPRDMTKELMEAHRDIPCLMPLLHLPVQSGSDKVLKAMNRQYTRAFYEDVIQGFRQTCPHIAFSSDFIVGHPGETDEDFQQTCDLVKTVKFAQAYSFSYSPRPGTPSALKAQLPEAVKAERLQVLQTVLREQQLSFNQSMKGQEVDILVDRKGKYEGQIMGKTPYLQSVYLEGERIMGSFMTIRVREGFLNSLVGDIIEQSD